MLLTKSRKAFLVRYKKSKDMSRKLYSSVAYIKQSYNKRVLEEECEIVEFDLVEVGVIDGKDIDTRFPSKKKAR